MRPLILTLPLLALAACGDGKSSDSAALDRSSIRTGGTAESAESAAPATAPASTGAPTEAEVAAFVTRKAKLLATGIGSSHSGVTVNVQSVQIAPGRAVNAQDKIDGIAGETTWPVRARWVEHRTWGAGSTEDAERHFGYSFYRNSFGEWDAVGHGPVT